MFTSSLWVKLLMNANSSGYMPYVRYSGFLYGDKNLQTINRILNECIKVINNDGRYWISETASGEWTQEFSNTIHHHFECLIGSVEKKADFYIESSELVQHAICGLNHCAHDLEALKRAELGRTINPNNYFSNLIVEFMDAPGISLPAEAYELFDLNVDFGDLYLHYSDIGKTWWEVYYDKDADIFSEAIRPYRVLSAGFDIFFGDFKISKKEKLDFDRFLREHNVDPSNKKESLGWLKLGIFNCPKNLNREEVRKIIGEYSNVQNISLVRLLDDGEEQLLSKIEIKEKSPYLYLKKSSGL